jgi:hypothetical protein
LLQQVAGVWEALVVKDAGQVLAVDVRVLLKALETVDKEGKDPEVGAAAPRGRLARSPLVRSGALRCGPGQGNG